MNDRKTQINPPLYLAGTMISCWRCGAAMPAVCIIAPNVPEIADEVCILSDITELPASVLAFIQKRYPSFKKIFSKTTEAEYYANTCPKCGVLSGDFYLHSEPGGPFFPESEADAALLIVELIPIEDPVEVVAELGMGCGDLILKHGKRCMPNNVIEPIRRRQQIALRPQTKRESNEKTYLADMFNVPFKGNLADSVTSRGQKSEIRGQRKIIP